MNVHRAKKLWRENPNLTVGVDLLLASGGDERIIVDPATGRNRYGTSATPTPHEIFLSSSTASTITSRVYRAVEMAWADLTAGSIDDRRGMDAWFDSIRARLLHLFGIEKSSVVLTRSGTDAELISLAIAKSIGDGPLTNIVFAPAETGSGVLRAAGGAHFLNSTPFGERRLVGNRLRGWEDADIEVAAVEIRNPQGDLRVAADIDAEARSLAGAAIQAGRNVLLHLLQTSKTGRSGLTDSTAV
jgi:hypothetical protein